jgi:hypothetical protein
MAELSLDGGWVGAVVPEDHLDDLDCGLDVSRDDSAGPSLEQHGGVIEITRAYENANIVRQATRLLDATFLTACGRTIARRKDTPHRLAEVTRKGCEASTYRPVEGENTTGLWEGAGRRRRSCRGGRLSDTDRL